MLDDFQSMASQKIKQEKINKIKLDNKESNENKEHWMNALFKDEIINRAPDKMIDVQDGYIMLAYRNVLILCSIKEHGVDDDYQQHEDNEQEGKFYDIEVPQEKVHVFNLH